MPTATLKVTPEQLKAESDKIQSTTPAYTAAYNKLYADVSIFASAGIWSGEANDSFQRQIAAFKNDFIALEKLLLDDFKRVLADASSKYGTTESNLVVGAQKLPTSSN